MRSRKAHAGMRYSKAYGIKASARRVTVQETPKKKSRKAVYCTPVKTAKSKHSAFRKVQLANETSSDRSFRPRSSSPAPKAKVGNA